MNTLSIIIPAFKSRDILPVLLSQIQEIENHYTDGFEVIVINDNGKDACWAALRNLQRKYQWLRPVCLSRNYGQHNAILCGIRLARHPIIVTMDDDLQHSPQSIPALVAKMSEGYDVVYGYPDDERHSVLRRVASWLTKLALSRAMGAETARHISAFRAIRTDLRESFSGYSGFMVSIDVLLTWGGSRFATVIVPHSERYAGTSNYTLRALVRHALNMVTGFSLLPLKVAGTLGLLAITLGIIILGYVLFTYFFVGGTYPGFTFLAASIAIFSGVQLVALGILGEYVGRIHLQTLKQPSYSIRAMPESKGSTTRGGGFG